MEHPFLSLSTIMEKKMLAHIVWFRRKSVIELSHVLRRFARSPNIFWWKRGRKVKTCMLSFGQFHALLSTSVESMGIVAINYIRYTYYFFLWLYDFSMTITCRQILRGKCRTRLIKCSHCDNKGKQSWSKSQLCWVFFINKMKTS